MLREQPWYLQRSRPGSTEQAVFSPNDVLQSFLNTNVIVPARVGFDKKDVATAFGEFFDCAKVREGRGCDDFVAFIVPDGDLLGVGRPFFFAESTST